MGHVAIYIEDDPDTKEFAYRVEFTGPADFEGSAAHRAAVHISEFLDAALKEAGGTQLEAEDSPKVSLDAPPPVRLHTPPAGLVTL